MTDPLRSKLVAKPTVAQANVVSPHHEQRALLARGLAGSSNPLALVEVTAPDARMHQRGRAQP